MLSRLDTMGLVPTASHRHRVLGARDTSVCTSQHCFGRNKHDVLRRWAAPSSTDRTEAGSEAWLLGGWDGSTESGKVKRSSLGKEGWRAKEAVHAKTQECDMELVTKWSQTA